MTERKRATPSRTPRAKPAELILMEKLSRDVSLTQGQMAQMSLDMGAQTEAMHSIKNAVQGIPLLVKRLETVEATLQARELSDIEERAEKKGMMKLAELVARFAPIAWTIGIGLIAWFLGKRTE